MKRFITGWLAVVWTAGMLLTGYSGPLPHSAVTSSYMGSELKISMPGTYIEDEPGAKGYTEPDTGNKAGIPIVYTSMDKQRGKYSKKMKALFNGLWDHIGAH